MLGWYTATHRMKTTNLTYRKNTTTYTSNEHILSLKSSLLSLNSEVLCMHFKTVGKMKRLTI